MELHLVSTVCGEDDVADQTDRPEGERRSGSDRREERPSAWADPRTWMTLCGLLLAFLGFISTQLASINGGIQALRESNATKTEQISGLQRDVQHLQSQHDTQEQVNQQVRDRLSRVEGLTGIQQEKKP